MHCDSLSPGAPVLAAGALFILSSPLNPMHLWSQEQAQYQEWDGLSTKILRSGKKRMFKRHQAEQIANALPLKQPGMYCLSSGGDW